jgi:hypothetical protein
VRVERSQGRQLVPAQTAARARSDDRLTKRGKAAFAHNYLLGVYISAAFTRVGEKIPSVSDSSLNATTF